MEQQLGQSLIANSSLSEKLRYEYIFVDVNNHIHISVPLSSGTEIALDNTCKTANEINTFAGLVNNQGVLISIARYIRDITKDIDRLMEQEFLSDELVLILQKKQQRLLQLQNAQVLLQSLIPSLQQSVLRAGTNHLPELITENAFKTNRENCVSIILYPLHRDDCLNTSRLALFQMKRGNLRFENSFGGKLSATIRAQLEQYKNSSSHQEKGKITTIEGIIDAAGKTLGNKINLSRGDVALNEVKSAVETVLIGQGLDEVKAKSLTNDLFIVNDTGDREHPEKSIFTQFIIDSEMLDNNNEITNYPVSNLKPYLLEKTPDDLFDRTVEPLRMLLEMLLEAPESKFFNIKEPIRFSVAVEFFLGMANVQYYKKTGKPINFANELEEKKGLDLIVNIKAAIINNQPIEPVIFAFINEILLVNQTKLDDTDQTAIIQRFSSLYNLVKGSDHMDEFFFLIPRKGHYVTHQGRICIQLSEYCKQVNLTLYKQFFGGHDPRLSSQPLANDSDFILPPSNKATIQIGSIPVDFTHINHRSVDDLVRILLAEDPNDSEKKFFHTASDAIKRQFKTHPEWLAIQNRMIGSLNLQSQMMAFCVGWKLVQPLHLTPNMIHALIAQYGMEWDLENLTGKALLAKISIIFNALCIEQSAHKIPHEDGGLVLLFENVPGTNKIIERIQSICKERETTMHIYPNMAKSLYETVEEKKPGVLKGLSNDSWSFSCHEKSRITVALTNLLPDLTVYPENKIYSENNLFQKAQAALFAKKKRMQIEAEIENGSAISIKFYKKRGYLLQGTQENLARIRAIHLTHTRVMLNEEQIYRLLFALEKKTPKGELTKQQIEDIWAGESLPEALSLADVKNALDQFSLEYTQLQTDGVSYTISMENSQPLKELLAKNQILPDKLKEKKLKLIDKKTQDIESTIAKMQFVEIKQIKLIEQYNNELAYSPENQAKNLACLIDYEAEKIIAILEGAAEPKIPDLYTDLIQQWEKLNQKEQEQETKLAELNEKYKRQTLVLEEFKQKTNTQLVGFAKNIDAHILNYREREKAFFELQYKDLMYDPMWGHLTRLKDFLDIKIVDQLFEWRSNGMDFVTHKKVKINLDQLSTLKIAYNDGHLQYQNWKQSSINEVEKYLNSPNMFVRLYRFLFGNSRAMMEEIETKAAQINQQFQNTITHINEDFLKSIQMPDEPINLLEKYGQTFGEILQSNGILFDATVTPNKLESIAIEDAAAPLLEKCEAVETALPPLPKQLQLDLHPGFFSHSVNYSSIAADNAKNVQPLYCFVDQRNDNLNSLKLRVTQVKGHRSFLSQLEDPSLYNEFIEFIESKIAEAQKTMAELEQIDAPLLILMRTFMLDSQTKSTYEKLARQCQAFEKNISEIQNYCVDTEKLLNNGREKIEKLELENDKKVKKLTQKMSKFFEKFPLSKYEEKLDNIAKNFSSEKFKLWLDRQKMYQDAKTRIEIQTSEYVTYVNSYLNDNRVTGLTRLWRALFGDHTQNGIKLAQANAARMRSNIDKLCTDFDKKFSKVKNSVDLQKLLQKEANQLFGLLKKDDSGFDQHSYTTYSIGTNQAFQNNQNHFNFWTVAPLQATDDIPIALQNANLGI